MSGGLAIIGGGKIGEALLSGLLRRGAQGITVSERSADRAAELHARLIEALPRLVGFAISFLALAMFWMGNQRILRNV